MALLSAYEAAAVNEPGYTRGDAAGIAYAIRSRVNEGYSFATSRDYVLGRQDYRARIASLIDNGWNVRNPTLLWDSTTLTGP